MSKNHPVNKWVLSNREEMLRGLKGVLSQITGVRFVTRQPITQQLLAEPQLPAIIISDTQVDMSWLSRDTKQARVRSSIVLDLQAYAPRDMTKGGTYTQSEVREAFAAEVVRTLANNPMLKIQLSGEDEALYHANDATSQLPRIQHLRVQPPYTRSLITLAPIETEEDLRLSTPSRTWQSITLDIFPQPETGDPYIPGFDLDLGDFSSGFDPDHS